MIQIFNRNRPLFITALIVFAVLAVTAFRYEPRVFASMILSGLTLGALYFMVSSGLSLIFGLMDVLNFAHG
ncbi:MAG: branched-chain amino acid ABC transporter permease, partial [Chloroflexota bacterium]